MQRLLHSSKFWTFVVAQVIVLATYFVTKYAGGAMEDVHVVLGFVEGLAAILIGTFCAEDVAAKAGAATARLSK